MAAICAAEEDGSEENMATGALIFLKKSPALSKISDVAAAAADDDDDADAAYSSSESGGGGRSSSCRRSSASRFC